MLPITSLTKAVIRNIKLIVLDVDGVLVPRGTKIKQFGNKTIFETKKIGGREIEMIKKLKEKGFFININSGRGLYMLEEMFREILPFVSLTYENGSATWFKGRVYQHVNSFEHLRKILPKLQAVKNKNIKGFEPKEFIISIHCKKRVKEIEGIAAQERKLYCIWNSEAYDIGVKKIQTKAVGVKAVAKLLHLKKNNILVIGDNYNDREMMKEGGIAVTADKTRVKGDFYVPFKGKVLPAGLLMGQILRVL